MMKKLIKKIKIISLVVLLISSICSIGWISSLSALTTDNHVPILYYDFDSESAVDQMGNYSGTLVNEPQFIDGKSDFGKAMKVTEKSYLQLPANFKLSNQDFTLSFLIRSLETKNDTVLFANKDGVSGNVGYNGNRYDTSSYSRDETVLDGKWHHVVITADRDQSLALYVDGNLSSENKSFSELAGISLDTASNYVLGAGSTGEYLQGALYDEFMVYDVALSLEEIQSLYLKYADDTGSELQEQLDVLTAGEVRVSLSADSEMKTRAVSKFIENQLNDEPGISVAAEMVNDNTYLISLSKAGITVSKEMKFSFIEKDVLTVATYNIYGWGYPNLNSINEKLKEIDADIIGLQEANYQLDGNGQVEQLSNIGTYPYYAFKEGYGSSTFWGGSAIVSKYPLANKGGANYEINDDTNRSYVRATIQIDGKEIALYNTHIVWLRDPELYAQYKQAQINELIEAVNNDPTPYKIITGDFNSDQSKEELDQMLLNFNDANGWNNVWFETGELDSSMKIGCIDHIFTTTNIEFVNINVAEGAPSDHDILYADLRLKDSATLPTQLLDYTLKDAKTYLANEARYESVGINNLKMVVNEIENQSVTEENRYPNVIAIREAISKLQEKVSPISDPFIYYNFDNDVNNQYQNYDGKMVNNPSLASGFKNNVLEIGEGYVEIPGMKLGTEDFTISFWFKSNETKNDTVIFGNKSGDSGKDLGIFFCNYDGLFGNVGTGSVRYDTSANNRDKIAMDGNWHHLTVVGERSKALSLYVDGKLSSSNTDFANIVGLNLDTNDNYVIGAGSQGGYRQKGNIDEFKVYNYALDSAQVFKTYQDYFIDKTELQALYDEYLTLDEGDYTQESWKEFKTAMDNAKAVLEKADITQEEVDNTLTALQNAKEALTKVEAATVSKTALSIAVDMANNVTEEQLNKVVPVVVEEFNGALDEAKAILANDKATQEQVDASFARLASAMHMLEFYKGDKTELQSLVDATADLVEGNYTEESWTALQEALVEANTVMNDENAMQEEVDEAYDKLQAAIEGLEEAEVVDKTLLEAMVNKVLGLEENKYTESSWQAILPVLEKAQEVLASEEVSQLEVDSAYEGLIRAYLDLRLKPNKDVLNDLIQQANRLNKASYSAKTWNAVEKALEKANTVINDPEASQAEVDNAKEVLTKAMAGLETSNSVNTNTTSVATGDAASLMSGLVMMSVLGGGLYLFKRKG